MKNSYYEDLYHESEYRQEYYVARKFVLSLFNNENFPILGQNSQDSLHFYFEGHSILMLSAVRQIALMCHFPNYNEKTGENKTILTIVCPDAVTISDLQKVSAEISSSQCLGNLMSLCENRSLLYNGEEFQKNNSNSFLDIKIEIIGGVALSELKNEIGKNTFEILESDLLSVNLFNEDMRIDVTAAINVNMIYNIGVDITNLPSFDLANVEKYATAINVFSHRISFKEKLNKWNSGLSYEDKFSCVCCADCLRLRCKWLSSIGNGSVYEAIKTNIDVLAQTEHSRWNVEKLIMGYRTLTASELYTFSTLRYNARDRYRKQIRNKEKAHVDICSYHDLRRINPNDMRYDYFLMLALPLIVCE